ncbi:MAG: hypothetical protein WC717_01345 [Candidatus Micrarchaeia archaeon]|jgi:hypothetical protein
MPSSLQAFEQADSPFSLAARPGKSALPLLSLLTFSPAGNPLLGLSPAQRNLFFDYLLMSLHNQRKEHSERVAAINKKIALPASLSAAAIGARLSQERQARQGQRAQMLLDAQQLHAARLERMRKGMKKEEEGKILQAEKAAAGAASLEKGVEAGAGNGQPWAGGGNGAAGLAGWKVSSLSRKQEGEKKGGEEGGIGPAFHPALGQKRAKAVDIDHLFLSAFGQKTGGVSGAMGQLVPVIDDYARGNAEKEKRVVEGLHEHMRQQGYQADDMMSSLLMVIEDDAWAGEEGGLGSAKHHGGTTRIASLIPRKLRSTAQDSAVVRLASVREMLRYYFRLHPQDYRVALAAALGITADQEDDPAFLQERLAFEIASIGSFALAQKILAELKKKRKMDTYECLMRLGYRYDRKRKRLIIGKRTCGKPAEARGIIGLLLASARKE